MESPNRTLEAAYKPLFAAEKALVNIAALTIDYFEVRSWKIRNSRIYR